MVIWSPLKHDAGHISDRLKAAAKAIDHERGYDELPH